MRVRVLGSGDAFGSGGRLQACFLVDAGAQRFLIDCGATALVAMKRFDVDPNAVELILLSHLHGDHFGGIPFFALEAQFVSRRTRPLVIAGPRGTRRRLETTMEALFPGSVAASRRFQLDVLELEEERTVRFGDVEVTGWEVEHPSGAPAFALRVESGGRVLAYSGDTEWTEALIPAARAADLLIVEAYFFDKRVPFHLDFKTLMARMDELGAKRILLTHMSDDMLGRLDELACEWAEDGMSLEV